MTYYKPKQIIKGAIAISWFLILLAPSQWLPKNRRFLELKILLNLSSVIASWSLIYQHRPGRLDHEFTQLEKEKQRIEAQFSARQKELDQSVNQTLQEIGEISQAELAQAQQEMDSLLAQKDQELAHWQNLYYQANAPKQPILNCEAAFKCWSIQHTLWKHGIILDAHNQPPVTIPTPGTPQGKIDYYVLSPRNQEHFERLIKDKAILTPLMEYALGDSGGIKYEQIGQQIKITYTPGAQTSTVVEAQKLEKKPVN